MDPDLFYFCFLHGGFIPWIQLGKDLFLFAKEGRKAGEGRKEGRPDPAKVWPDRVRGSRRGSDRGTGGAHGEKPKNRRKAGRTDPPPPQKISVFISVRLRQTSGITPTLISSK
jgi:hypothetical protein